MDIKQLLRPTWKKFLLFLVLYIVLPLPIYFCFDGCSVSVNLPTIWSLFLHWITVLLMIKCPTGCPPEDVNLLVGIPILILHIILMFAVYWLACMIIERRQRGGLILPKKLKIILVLVIVLLGFSYWQYSKIEKERKEAKRMNGCRTICIYYSETNSWKMDPHMLESFKSRSDCISRCMK